MKCYIISDSKYLIVKICDALTGLITHVIYMYIYNIYVFIILYIL